jgi:hypothetical protein
VTKVANDYISQVTLPNNVTYDFQTKIIAAPTAITHNYILITSTTPTVTSTDYATLGSNSMWINSADKGKFELVLGNATATSTAGG